MSDDGCSESFELEEEIYIEKSKSLNFEENKESSCSQILSNSCYSKKSKKEEDIRYYEFEIQQIKDISNIGIDIQDLTLLNIKDVTQIVKNQMKMSDMIY